MISLSDYISISLNEGQDNLSSYSKNTASLVFVGDAMNNPHQREIAKKLKGYNYNNYYTKIKPFIQSKDYACVNLETPIYKQRYLTKVPSCPIFWAPPSYLSELKNAGFDMFFTANNHALDQGQEGIKNTIDMLKMYGCDHIGTYKSQSQRNRQLPFIKNINGIRIGFVNYTYKTTDEKPEDNLILDCVVDYINEKRIKADIDFTKQNGAEFIICYIHWGEEHESMPTQEQIDLGNKIFEYGADVIIGSHPHVIQPIIYKDNKLIAYSLGNFVSSMKKNYGGLRDTKGGLVLNIDLIKTDVVKIKQVSYKFIYTEFNEETNNMEVNWATDANDLNSGDFLREARKFFREYNVGVFEDRY